MTFLGGKKPTENGICIINDKEKKKEKKNDGEARRVDLHCNCGRVVKASDSKSDSLWERRFESCRLRMVLLQNWKNEECLVLWVSFCWKVHRSGWPSGLRREA